MEKALQAKVAGGLGGFQRANFRHPLGELLLQRQRASTVEPVFGIIKSVLGLRQFLLRGLKKVSGEWNLVCLAWNLQRLHRLRGAAAA